MFLTKLQQSDHWNTSASGPDVKQGEERKRHCTVRKEVIFQSTDITSKQKTNNVSESMKIKVNVIKEVIIEESPQQNFKS